MKAWLIRLLRADTDVFRFSLLMMINWCRCFCITQTTVERHYFIAMKNNFTVMRNCTAWNSVQTWVTKQTPTTTCILICSQPFMWLTCERMLLHRVVYWDDCAVVCTLHTTALMQLEGCVLSAKWQRICINPLTTARANILARPFLAKNCQSLESCSNPLRIQQVF